MISHEILSCNSSNNTEVQKRYLTFIITNITSVSSVVDNNILFAFISCYFRHDGNESTAK